MGEKQHEARKQKGPGKPWRPGQSGNPKGRPPLAKALNQIIRDVGMEPDEATGRARVEEAVRRLWRDAKNGRVAAAELMFERGWGKLPAPVTVTWEHKVVEAIVARSVGYSDVEAELGAELALELFRQAGVEVEK